MRGLDAGIMERIGWNKRKKPRKSIWKFCCYYFCVNSKSDRREDFLGTQLCIFSLFSYKKIEKKNILYSNIEKERERKREMEGKSQQTEIHCYLLLLLIERVIIVLNKWHCTSIYDRIIIKNLHRCFLQYMKKIYILLD